jgi:fermentation-respiration switch protein FrsA (DUF1100 family)
MLNALFMVLTTSYVAWYMERFELAAIYPFDTTYAAPAEAGVPGLIETRVATPDGAELVVWRHAAAPGKPTVVYFCGNAGTLKDRADRFRKLAERGFGVVAPAYRGSSGSTGKPDEALLVADARLVAEGVAGPVVLYGESLGAAVAIRLGAEGLGQRVVLEAPFTSVTDLVAAQYPAEDLAHLITQRWDSLGTVGALRQPLLVLHGDADRTVPFAMGERIVAAAGSAEKSLITVRNHGHSGLWTVEVQERVYAFLGK